MDRNQEVKVPIFHLWWNPRKTRTDGHVSNSLKCYFQAALHRKKEEISRKFTCITIIYRCEIERSTNIISEHQWIFKHGVPVFLFDLVLSPSTGINGSTDTVVC